jgi:hypothetical protein
MHWWNTLIFMAVILPVLLRAAYDKGRQDERNGR